jgi:hypothetical protein
VYLSEGTAWPVVESQTLETKKARGGIAMPLGEDFGNYSAAQLDAIVEAGGGLRRGKTRKDLKAALGQAFLAAQLHAAYQRSETTSPATSDEFEKVACAS